MKKSLFTVEYPSNDGSRILFNTLNGALALARPSASKEELADAGFMVDDDLDEEKTLATRFLRDMNETGFLSLCIAPTLACNLRCVYCYEEHEQVSMSDEVESAVLDFVERRHKTHPFSDLDVLWYGGEPLIELERIESLSAKLISWCELHSVAYRARITTNASLIDDAVGKRLAAIKIESAMPTLDGCEPRHNTRRPRANGTGSYRETLTGIKALRKAGINIDTNLNLGWDNVDDFRVLREELSAEGTCPIYASHLRNYGGWCAGCKEGSNSPCKGTSESPNAPMLMSRAAYAKQLFELYRETDPSAYSVALSLQAKRSFCHGKMASYFVIDPEGYVCRCDGRMRDSEYRLFNVLDGSAQTEWPQVETPYDLHPRCRGCAIMPLCLGDCDWEWSMFEDNCSALKYTLEDYVRLLVDKLQATIGNEESLLQLMAPADVDARYSKPFSPFDDSSVM